MRVIIVDDDSPDGTWEIAEKLKTIYNIKVLRRLDKRGLSSAVIDGFKIASGDIIGVMDADMSHPPEKIPELLQPLLSGDADFVIGSRYVEGARIENWPLGRKVSSRIAHWRCGLTGKGPNVRLLFFSKRSNRRNRTEPERGI
jgi:dolichol-phosphate mannosyltransferase